MNICSSEALGADRDLDLQVTCCSRAAAAPVSTSRPSTDFRVFGERASPTLAKHLLRCTGSGTSFSAFLLGSYSPSKTSAAARAALVPSAQSPPISSRSENRGSVPAGCYQPPGLLAPPALSPFFQRKATCSQVGQTKLSLIWSKPKVLTPSQAGAAA